MSERDLPDDSTDSTPDVNLNDSNLAPELESESAGPQSVAVSHLRPLLLPLLDKQLFASLPPPPTSHPSARETHAAQQSIVTSPTPPRPVSPPSTQATTAAKLSVESRQISFPVAKSPPVRPRDSDKTIASDKASQPAAGQEGSAAFIGTPTTVGKNAEMRRRPLFGFVIYLALAFGTFPVLPELRFTVLWLLLLGMGVGFLFFDDEPSLGGLDVLDLSWGVGVGFVISLPLLILAGRGLAQTSRALVPLADNPALLQALVLTWPLGDTLFYRGVVQREHGLVVGALAAGVGSAILYWPEAEGVFAVLFVAVTFATALAFVFGYVRLRYGLAAAYVCQVVANLMLLFVPRLLVAS